MLGLTLNELLAIALGVSVLAYLFAFVVLKRHNKKEKQQKTGIVEKAGVRFTLEDAPVEVVNEETGKKEANTTYIKKDILIRRGFKYVVGDKNKIKEGKYTILTTEDGVEEFSIRRNGYVKTYKHNSNIVLSNADELTPVSLSIILR